MLPVILLFAKAPVPGHVKTRLRPVLSAAQAADLHRAFVLDTLGILSSLDGVDVELHTDTSTDAWRGVSVAVKLQAEGNLGVKLLSAANAALRQGRPHVLIAGSDSPTLPEAHLDALRASSANVALGPCDDGGYYAVGFRRTHPAMFDGVTWSAATTLQETVAACRRCGLTVETGRPWFDVDSPADLVRLMSAPQLRSHTAAWFAAHGPSLAGRLACARR